MSKSGFPMPNGFKVSEPLTCSPPHTTAMERAPTMCHVIFFFNCRTKLVSRQLVKAPCLHPITLSLVSGGTGGISTLGAITPWVLCRQPSAPTMPLSWLGFLMPSSRLASSGACLLLPPLFLTDIRLGFCDAIVSSPSSSQSPPLC